MVSKRKILYILPNTDLRKVPSEVKSLPAGKIIPAAPLAGQLKHFLNSRKMLTKGSRHFICSGRLQNTFLHKTTSEKNTTKYPHESSTGKSGGYGNFGNADKGSYLIDSEI